MTNGICLEGLTSLHHIVTIWVFQYFRAPTALYESILSATTSTRKMQHFEPQKSAFTQRCCGETHKIDFMRSRGIGFSKKRSLVMTLGQGKHFFGVEPHFGRTLLLLIVRKWLRWRRFCTSSAFVSRGRYEGVQLYVDVDNRSVAQSLLRRGGCAIPQCTAYCAHCSTTGAGILVAAAVDAINSKCQNRRDYAAPGDRVRSPPRGCV